MKAILLASLTSVLTLASPTIAGPIDPYRAETEAMLLTADGEYACFPLKARPSRVYVVSTYYGGDQVDPSQPAAGASATRFADVRVSYTDKPVLVVAVAHEPIVWRFDIADGVTIAGVQLFGYYEQYVTGLPAGTPMGRAYDANSDGSKPLYCGDPTADRARKEINRAIESYADEYIRADQHFNLMRTRAGFFADFARQWADIQPSDDIVAQTQALLDKANVEAELARLERLNLMDKLSEARGKVALLDDEGRLPPPIDGWFAVNYKQDLSDLAAAIHMFGHYMYADYRHLQHTIDEGFTIGQDGVLGPPLRSLGESLPDRPG